MTSRQADPCRPENLERIKGDVVHGIGGQEGEHNISYRQSPVKKVPPRRKKRGSMKE